VEIEKLSRTPPPDWEPQKEHFRGRRLYSPDFARYVVAEGASLSLFEDGSGREIKLAEGNAVDVSWRLDAGSWSPDGTWLAVSRMDVSRIHHLPIIDYSEAEEKVSEVVYSKSGGGFMRIEAVLFHTASGEKVVAEIGAYEDIYLYNLDGELIRRLTAGEFPVLEIEAVDVEKDEGGPRRRSSWSRPTTAKPTSTVCSTSRRTSIPAGAIP